MGFALEDRGSNGKEQRGLDRWALGGKSAKRSELVLAEHLLKVRHPFSPPVPKHDKVKACPKSQGRT